MILKSYAKLNLYLNVLNLRKDNFHNIETLFERISLADTIILKSRRDKQISIKSNSKKIPCDASNLAYRAAKLLQDSFKVNKGVDITIIKRIPVGAGLGGGSSNAAAVLLGLNRLWRLKLSREKLVQLARKIGSDVTFFIYDIAFALGRGRGDKIQSLNSFNKMRLWHILVVPKIEISTPFVYRKWDRQVMLKPEKVGLTQFKYNVKILLSALKSGRLSLAENLLFNSLQQVAMRLYPEINRIIEKLKRLGVRLVLMSGSGSAVFGIVPSKREAIILGRQLMRNRFWQVFVVKTV